MLSYFVRNFQINARKKVRAKCVNTDLIKKSIIISLAFVLRIS